MDLLLRTLERHCEEKGSMGDLQFEEKSKKNGFIPNDRHLEPFSLSSQRRRQCSSSKIFFLQAFVLFALLAVNRCSGFVVGEQWKHRGQGHSVVTDSSGDSSFHRTLLYAATKTKEPTWREKLYKTGHDTPERSKSDAYHSDHDHDVVDTESQEENDFPCSSSDAEVGRECETTIHGEEADGDDLMARRKKAASRAAILARRDRQGVRAMNKMDALRKTAQVTSSSDPVKTDLDKKSPSTTSSARVSQSIIQSAIADILRSRDAPASSMIGRARGMDDSKLTAAFSSFGRTIGVLGESSLSNGEIHTSLRIHSDLLQLLKRSEKATTDPVAVRLATSMDDVDIVSLRLSVFSDFPPDLQSHFCARSCQAIKARRMRGATCVVATTPCQNSIPGSQSSLILGSAECSFHEFFGTQLGQRRPQDSLLYITEFAVNPSFRRKGVGLKILAAIETLAECRDVQTLYLHVDVENQGALNLYLKAGYRKVSSADPIFLAFTTSLNLHPGATKGREHFLLHKNLVSEPTWLDNVDEDFSSCQVQQRGGLGFEIPA